MMRFIFGTMIGALGFWAYKNGYLPTQASEMLDRMLSPGGPSAGGDSEIIRPTAREIAERPLEPIPGARE